MILLSQPYWTTTV